MSKRRKHWCACPHRDEHCEPHDVWQWGGGEPDICEEHGHGWIGGRPEAIAELRAKRDTLRAMRGFSRDRQARILQAAIEQLSQSDPEVKP